MDTWPRTWRIRNKWHTILQNKRMRWCGVSPPTPIIFERLRLPQQIIYLRKGNLSQSPKHFKYRKNILISRFYEQFSRSSRILDHFWKFTKNSNFAVLQKHLRISQNILLFLSSQNLNILGDKLYIWNFQITRFKMIYDMFVFQEFEIFSNF